MSLMYRSSLIAGDSTTFDPTKYLKPGLTELDVLQIKEVFDSFDTRASGFLNPMDVRTALFKHNFNAKRDTTYHIISEYDTEEHGDMCFDDFVKMCANTRPPQETKDQVRSIFLKYDKKRQGFFTLDDLKSVAKELGEKVEDEELEEMINRLSIDGKVHFEEFYNAMTKRIY